MTNGSIHQTSHQPDQVSETEPWPGGPKYTMYKEITIIHMAYTTLHTQNNNLTHTIHMFDYTTTSVSLVADIASHPTSAISTPH